MDASVGSIVGFCLGNVEHQHRNEVGNDFNGNDGVVGMVNLLAASGAEASGTVISWNTFVEEHPEICTANG